MAWPGRSVDVTGRGGGGAGCCAAARVGRGGGGPEPEPGPGPVDDDAVMTGRTVRVGAATCTALAKTSGHPEKRPVHTVSQIAQVHADAPAFIGWLQPLVIWQPNSWHQPIGRPS